MSSSPMRVAIIGYGHVAAVHARQLARESGVQRVTVFGPNQEKAWQFASKWGIPAIGSSLREAVAQAEAAIVCSPSAMHFEQARECLGMGVHTLVEMPPCARAAEARELGEAAQEHGVRVACTHTSRYMAPYRHITESLRAGELGVVQQVSYIRHHRLLERTWRDDALLHHAAHPLDTLIAWFGGITPAGCVALPKVCGAESVSLLGKLPNGAPADISITYASRLPHVRMLIVGDQHTVETDGFTYVRSDLEPLRLETPDVETYERAIHDQDMAFFGACRGSGAGVDWREAVKVMEAVNRFQELGAA